MTREQESLLKKKKWTKFLKTLEVGRQYMFALESVSDMDTIATLCTRYGRREDWGMKFSIKSVIESKTMIISVTPRGECGHN